MNNLTDSISRTDRLVIAALLLLSLGLYFYGLGNNAVWTQNEGYYTDAVRTMLETGDWMDIRYNGEPRYQKPPLVYWLMALSAALFGLKEWALRLPIVLGSLGAVWLTYVLTALLSHRKTGLLAAFVMFFSFQFAINARYATPDAPLTFFLLLTLYGWIRGLRERNRIWAWTGYLGLGLTLLMKGFPFLIILAAIFGLFLFWQHRGNWRNTLREVWWMQPLLGFPAAMGMGFSWLAYMYWTAGDAFHEVFMSETVNRAFTEEKPYRLSDLTFYWEANLWGFLPYSLVFYATFLYLIFQKFKSVRQSPLLQLALVWFGVWMAVFTVSKGKIPTYFMQAHPPMSMLAAWGILSIHPEKGWRNWLWEGAFWLPAVVFTIIGAGLVWAFGLPPWWYVLPLLPWPALWIRSAWCGSRLLPYTTTLAAFVIFMTGVLPPIERDYRDYRGLTAALEKRNVPADVPMQIEGRLMDNLPFYTHRKLLQQMEPDSLEAYGKVRDLLAVVPGGSAPYYGEVELLWKGNLFSKDSEARFLEFLIAIWKHRRGEPSAISTYYLIYKPVGQ